MDNPERDLEEREAGLELVLFSIIIVFYFSYAVHNITLLVLPSFSLSPFPFPSFSLPLSPLLSSFFLPFLTTTFPPTRQHFATLIGLCGCFLQLDLPSAKDEDKKKNFFLFYSHTQTKNWTRWSSSPFNGHWREVIFFSSFLTSSI